MPNKTQQKPAGFDYFPDFISQHEESFLLKKFSNLVWEKVKMHGVIAKRRVVHFGLQYTYESRSARPGKKLPLFLTSLIERVAKQMKVPTNEIVEILITEYPVGSGIGWHRDASLFGEQIFGLSLLSPCHFKLRIKRGDTHEIFKMELAPRSAYLLTGEARTCWQHSIPPVKQKRYSVTFRTLAKK